MKTMESLQVSGQEADRREWGIGTSDIWHEGSDGAGQ